MDMKCCGPKPWPACKINKIPSQIPLNQADWGFEYRNSGQCLHLLDCSEQELHSFSLKLFWNWYLHNTWFPISFVNAFPIPNKVKVIYLFIYEVWDKILWWMVYLRKKSSVELFHYSQWNLLLVRHLSKNRIKKSYWEVFDIPELLHWRHSNFIMQCQKKPSKMGRVQLWVLPLTITCILNK